MRKLFLATVAAVALSTSTHAEPLPYVGGCWSIPDAAECTETDAAIDATIAAAVAAPPVVRDAFTLDVCSAENRDDILDHTEMRDALPVALQPVYDGIGALLLAVYRTTEQTDGELEAARNDFCDGLTEQD